LRVVSNLKMVNFAFLISLLIFFPPQGIYMPGFDLGEKALAVIWLVSHAKTIFFLVNYKIRKDQFRQVHAVFHPIH